MRPVHRSTLFALLLAGTSSEAMAAEKIAGTLRLSLDATVLEYVHTTVSGVPAAGPSPPGAPRDQEVTASQTTVGLIGSGVGLGLAGAVDENFVIGGRLSVGSSETDLPYQSSTSTAFSLMPFVEIIPTSSGLALPFISVTGGYRHASSEPSGGTETTASSWLVGAGVGSHLFAAPSFSIDPAVAVFYASGGIESGPVSLETQGLSAVLSIGLSGWIPTLAPNAATGGSTETQPDRSPAPAEASGLRVVDDRGRLTTTFTLESLPADPPGQHPRLVITGEPRTDGANATVTVMGLVMPSKEAGACNALVLEVEGLTTALTDVKPITQVGFSGSEVTLQGKVEVRALEKLGESRGESAIAFCGGRRLIPQAHRANVYEWMEQFRAKARAAGTWRETR